MAEAVPTGFEILAPAQWTAPMVFNSPHSGSHLPPYFLAQSRLTASQLRASEDTHADVLFSGCLDVGAPMMRALVSRSYVDLNREPYEFDARMFREKLPAYVNCASPRVASGLGTIPRTVGDGTLIYDGPIDFAEAVGRIENIYRPYHRALGALLDEAHSATGMALLVDCHSMPSSAVTHMRGRDIPEVDVVLGDRFGSACAAEVGMLVENRLVAAGLHVSRNRPYSGGFFTENHGRPRTGRHALQIEVNRALYMNEQSHEQNAGFAEMQSVLSDVARLLGSWLAQQGATVQTGYAAAAEEKKGRYTKVTGPSLGRKRPKGQ